MQLKFSKKSLRRDKASGFEGKGRKIWRRNRSPKTSGFQLVHLWSSTETSDMVRWKDWSPVLVLTHWIPLGEKMEKPDDDPALGQQE